MKEKSIILILFIISIIIIILFLLIGKLGVIEVKSPTGYVDIFDINIIECSNCCDCVGECDETCNCGGVFSEKNEKENDIVVEDKDVRYTNKTPLKIFSHRTYNVVEDVIAPESQNTYQFIIRNNNEFGIVYNLKMDEENPYNINMKYRLRKNGELIIGDENNWKTAQELKNISIKLANDSYDVYTLDWKWFESENDVEIGTAIEANYKLNISFFASRL